MYVQVCAYWEGGAGDARARAVPPRGVCGAEAGRCAQLYLSLSLESAAGTAMYVDSYRASHLDGARGDVDMSCPASERSAASQKQRSRRRSAGWRGGSALPHGLGGVQLQRATYLS